MHVAEDDKRTDQEQHGAEHCLYCRVPCASAVNTRIAPEATNI